MTVVVVAVGGLLGGGGMVSLLGVGRLLLLVVVMGLLLRVSDLLSTVAGLRGRRVARMLGLLVRLAVVGGAAVV